MRRRKNIIVSAITCMFSLCLMMIGVYAASSPSVSINGQVSYTARDASVLVQGKTYGADGYETGEYKEITDPTSPKTSDVLTNSVSQYLDYTSADQNKTTLATWDLGNNLKFYEDQNGIRKVYVYLKFTNLSNYPITASAKFESKTATNVKTTQSPSDGKMAMTTVGNVGSDCEMSFALEVEDDSKNASINFELVVTIEKTVLQSYTATFSSGTKQFTNQSNATSYNVNEATVLEEAPELYFSENGGERRVVYWYDNPECQGEPIKFPYVLSGNKTFYSAWEQNTKIFNFFDYGNDVQVYFDGYPAFRAQSLASASMVFRDLQTYGITVQLANGARTLLVLSPENILGIKFFNNFLYDTVDQAFYVIPNYDFETLSAIASKASVEQYKKIRSKGYVLSYEERDEAIEVKFVSKDVVEAPDVQISQVGKQLEPQVGYNVTNQLNGLTPRKAILHSGSEHQFVTGIENEKYVTTDTKEVSVAILTNFNSKKLCYSWIRDNVQTTGNELYVAEWYDNAELSGQPISLPYTFTSEETHLYAKWEYNDKTYKIDRNAENIEIWFKGRKILGAKNTGFIPTSSDEWASGNDHIISKSLQGSSGTIWLNHQFKQSDIIYYADNDFKIEKWGFFVSFGYFEADWNVIDYSKIDSADFIMTGTDHILQINSVSDGGIEVRILDYFNVGSIIDALYVYVNGVEAQYTLTNSPRD